MSEEVPQWAIERARVLAGLEAVTPFWTHAFARYIAAREQPPVDPDVIAMDAAVRAYSSTMFSVGNNHEDGVTAALSAFRKHKEAGK